RYWNSKVWKAHNEILTAQTHYSDNNNEVIITLKVNVRSFAIEQAWVEKYRNKPAFSEMKTIEGVRGLVAYIEHGAQFRKVLTQNQEDAVTIEVFNDTVRALIQAETFLTRERGFTSMQEYSTYWEKVYANTCKYYSHLDKIKVTWDAYADNLQRGNILYNRFKNQQLFAEGQNNYSISGTLLDQFHNMSIFLSVGKADKRVIKAEVNMIQVPDSICKDAAWEVNNLLGHDIGNLNKKTVARLLGEKEGCVHLIDLASESIETLNQYLS
ncbi:MAG TPA: DUF2889 domain-containing protein, partial [Syntrophomonadaceae bacterium]|nr:DUF2889 domain-containing protein [Syntrophomonadaceae bacterium]